MGRRAEWQAARRAALDGQSKMRRDKAARDKRLSALAVAALVAVRERDAAVAACERRAGAALRTMTDHEGLTLREAVQWCAGQITTRDATRLRRLAAAEARGAAATEPQAGDTLSDEPSRHAGEAGYQQPQAGQDQQLPADLGQNSSSTGIDNSSLKQ